MSRRGRPGRPRHGDGVVPLIYFSDRRVVLGVPAEVEVLAAHAGQLEDGLMLLEELDRRWGESGELADLTGLPPLVERPVSWDTVLLLAVCRPPGLEIEVDGQRVRRTGPVELPTKQQRRGMAADLVARELADAGCVAAAVAVGDRLRVIDSPVDAPFRLLGRSSEPAPGRCSGGPPAPGR